MLKVRWTILLSILFISLSPVCVFAQVDTAWVRRYNGPGNDVDRAYAIAVDSSGNVYVTGGSAGAGTSLDYATVKYDAAGAPQWARRYNGPGNFSDEARAIVVDRAGNVCVTGWSAGLGTGYDYATIKYNPLGDTQWVRRYNGPGDTTDMAQAIAVDSAGNVYVTGKSLSTSSGYDYATIKYNPAGVMQWVSRYDGPLNSLDIAYAIAVDRSGNVYVTGTSDGPGTGSDYTTIKYNSVGDTLWVRRYTGPVNPADDCAYAIALDASGNVHVTGTSYSGTMYDYATVKYSPAGVMQWASRYNGPANDVDEAQAVAVDGSGNVYVTGKSAGPGTLMDYATAKHSSAGETLWVRRYNGPANSEDHAYAAAADGSGNVYVTGRSVGTGSGFDYATIKYNTAGALQWMTRYNAPDNGDDEAYAMALDGAGSILVTGTSGSSTGVSDFLTIKYVQAGGISEENKEAMSNEQRGMNLRILQNPTTVRQGIKIRWTWDEGRNGTGKADRPSSDTRLQIYDVSGKIVQSLPITNNQSLITVPCNAYGPNGAALPAGVYFVQLKCGGLTHTTRVVLID